MPDITMCKGESCSIKDSCYRFRAIPDAHQSYFYETPYDEKTETCEYFIAVHSSSKLQLLEKSYQSKE